MTQISVLIFSMLLLASSGVWAEPAATQSAQAVQSTEFRTTEFRTPTNPNNDIQQLQRYFFAAARTGELTVLKEFLTAGYPVNERNAQSYTALMIAAYAGRASAVDVLLQAGADACLRDKRGHTALMGAMIKAEWDIARTLYDIDCDKENIAKATDVVIDKSQMTAAQFAEVFGQSDKFKAMMEAKNGLKN
jgi:ankyrin repeat protein